MGKSSLKKTVGLVLLSALFILVPTRAANAADTSDCINGKHQFDVKILSAAQEYEDGIREYTCELCGYSYREAIPMYGHSWGEWVIEKAATCQEEGVKYRTCTKYEHASIRQEEVIPIVSHQYGEWKIKKEPSEGTPGILYEECIYGCGTERESLIPALPEAKPTENAKIMKKPVWTVIDTVLVGSSTILFFIYGVLLYWDIWVFIWYRRAKKETMEKVKRGESLYDS